MSLLMDALKKAEQEKKEAAKKLVAGDDDLSVTRRANITDSHPVIESEASSTAPVEEPHVEPDADKTFHTAALDLALEPLEISNHNPLIARRPSGIISLDDTPQPVDPDATQNVLAEKLSVQDGFTTREAEPPIVNDDTRQISIADIQSSAALSNELDRTFHGVNIDTPIVAGLYDDTIQGEAYKPGDGHAYDETLPGVPAAQLARDIGTQDQPTPVAAQTLFTATGTVAKSSSGSRWLLVSLCLLAVGSAVVFYYYSVTPVSRDIPSPLVARGVETILSSQGAPNAAVSAVNSITPSPLPAEVPPVATTAVEQPVAMVTETGVVTPEIDPPPVAEAAAEPETRTAENPAAETAIPVAADRAEPAGLPAVIEPPASLVKISRSAEPTMQNTTINDAYNAWQQRDYTLAGTLYEQAYKQMPDNRDVLLGLAAVAGRTGNTPRAIQIYTRMVQLNPLDNVARAALLSLQPSEDATTGMSTIKSMLAGDPEQPSLHFTLGKLYASQSNWSAAQQAFFDAYRLDSSNPDYAFNLAVSLDRLGQSGTALDYYTVALGLAESGPAGFDPTVVRNRINALDAGE